jgi:hypothetical protein
MHELVYRRLLVYPPETDKIDEGNTMGNNKYVNKADESTTDRDLSCVTHYSPAVQDYNTTILFFHLVGVMPPNLPETNNQCV